MHYFVGHPYMFMPKNSYLKTIIAGNPVISHKPTLSILTSLLSDSSDAHHTRCNKQCFLWTSSIDRTDNIPGVRRISSCIAMHYDTSSFTSRHGRDRRLYLRMYEERAFTNAHVCTTVNTDAERHSATVENQPAKNALSALTAFRADYAYRPAANCNIKCRNLHHPGDSWEYALTTIRHASSLTTLRSAFTDATLSSDYVIRVARNAAVCIYSWSF